MRLGDDAADRAEQAECRHVQRRLGDAGRQAEAQITNLVVARRDPSGKPGRFDVIAANMQVGQHLSAQQRALVNAPVEFAKVAAEHAHPISVAVPDRATHTGQLRRRQAGAKPAHGKISRHDPYENQRGQAAKHNQHQQGLE